MESSRPPNTAGESVIYVFRPVVNLRGVEQTRGVSVAVEISDKLAKCFQAQHCLRNRSVTRFTPSLS